MKKFLLVLLAIFVLLIIFYLIKEFWFQNKKPLAPGQKNKLAIVDGESGQLKAEFLVELAQTAKQRQVGLMFRQHLEENSGMLFIFEQEKVHKFWMKDTYIPLDMIFINTDGEIVGIVENAQPQTLTPRFVNSPSRYVLEINAGLAKKYGINKKDMVINLVNKYE